MEITFETGYQMGKSKPIYLDKLTKEEADKLIAYFDRRMIPQKIGNKTTNPPKKTLTAINP